MEAELGTTTSDAVAEPALQARGYEWNQFALDAIPFVMTLAVLAVLGRRTLSSSPAELKRVFENAPT